MSLARSLSLDAPDGWALHKIAGGFMVTGELGGNLTLGPTYPNVLKIDAGGSHRDVTLDPEESSEGLWRRITNNSSGAENLVIKDDAANTIVTLNQNDQATFWCIGGAWLFEGVVTTAQS